MRVLIDTNVFVSYLLNPNQPGSIRAIVRAFLEDRFTLLVPEDLLEEFTLTVLNKPRLSKSILPKDLETFVRILKTYGEEVARIEDAIPTVTRDRKDDYLLAYAVVANADYLVTGDNDLLVLQGKILGLDIMTPAQFAELLS